MMKFCIGGHVYAVVIVDEPSINHDGELRGEVVTKRRAIRLFAPAEDVIDVFLHEYRHLWQIHLGEPIDEAECDRYSTITSALLNDLVRQGGLDRLSAIAPVDPTQGITS